MSGTPTGTVRTSTMSDDLEDRQLRVAFDFDGVLADDEAEKIFTTGGLADSHPSESANEDLVMNSGPLKGLLEKIAALQQLELAQRVVDAEHTRWISVGIITPRNAPADACTIQTLRA